MKKDYERLRKTIRDYANSLFEAYLKVLPNKVDSFTTTSNYFKEYREDLKYNFLSNTIFKGYNDDEIKELLK